MYARSPAFLILNFPFGNSDFFLSKKENTFISKEVLKDQEGALSECYGSVERGLS